MCVLSSVELAAPNNLSSTHGNKNYIWQTKSRPFQTLLKTFDFAVSALAGGSGWTILGQRLLAGQWDTRFLVLGAATPGGITREVDP
jgi:hypothetical protein